VIWAPGSELRHIRINPLQSFSEEAHRSYLHRLNQRLGCSWKYEKQRNIDAFFAGRNPFEEGRWFTRGSKISSR
jgi:hypothetical protein